MLQSFRDNLKGVTAAIVVGLLIIPFAFFGVESLFVSGSSVQEEVNVDGVTISRFEVDRGVEFYKRRMLSQYPDMDPALLDDDRIRDAVIDQLIQQNLLTLTARKNGMAIADQTFDEMVVGVEAFRENGKFSSDLYQFYLDRMGFTPRSYRQTTINEMLASHLSSGLQATAFATDRELRDFSHLALQQRSFDYVTLKAVNVDDVEVADDEIAAYYESNQERFTRPDQVVVEYIELTPDVLAEGAVISDEDVEARLAQAREAAAASASSWRLAHIMIDSGGEEGDRAIAAIEQGLAEGVPFDELARQYSADFGSAEAGGDLGIFTEDLLPDGFEDAVADLAEGEVAGPVTLDSGTHFIKVLEKTEAGEQPVGVTRDEIVAQLQREQAVDKLPAKLEQLKEETFSVDSLSSAADVLNLPVAVSPTFSRQGGDGIAAYPAVVDAAFSDEVFREGYASDAIELGENHFVVIKLKESVASHVAPLAEVEDQIRQLLRMRKAESRVREQAEAVVAALDEGETLSEVAAARELSLSSRTDMARFDQGLPQPLMQAVFQHPMSSSLPVHGSASSATGDFYVYSISGIKSGEANSLSAEENGAMMDSLRQISASREYLAYLEALKAGADIERFTDSLPAQ